MSFDSPRARSVDGAAFRLGIIAARFNETLVDGLLERLVAALHATGVKKENVDVHRVPGSHEVPWGIARLAETGRYDCVIALGVLIGGETNHHELVGESVSHALQRIAVDQATPVINGVIVTDTLEQARERCIGKVNRGVEFAHAASEMAALKARLEGHS